MRQNFWPQFQVGCRFEDHHLRRLHKDRVYSVHGMASVRWKPARPAMLCNFRGTGNTSSKIHFVKAKNHEKMRNHLPIAVYYGQCRTTPILLRAGCTAINRPLMNHRLATAGLNRETSGATVRVLSVLRPRRWPNYSACSGMSGTDLKRCLSR